MYKRLTKGAKWQWPEPESGPTDGRHVFFWSPSEVGSVLGVLIKEDWGKEEKILLGPVIIAGPTLKIF